MPKQQNQNVRTFKLGGRKVIIDDFFYRRIFRDSDVLPKRKYTFISGFCISCGYPRFSLKEYSKNILLSRYIMRAGKGEIVDHKNLNPLDNRRCNLRIATPRQNALNRKPKHKKGMIGVFCRMSDGKPYLRVRFRVNRTEKLNFSCPDTPFNRILAALARDKFVLQAGEEEYAPLNYPQWQHEPLRSILMKENLIKYKEVSSRKENSGAVDKKVKLNKKILRFCRKMTLTIHRREHRENKCN